MIYRDRKITLIIYLIFTGLIASCSLIIKRKPASNTFQRATANDSPQSAYNKCLNWAQVIANQKSSSNKLVIQYEGLAGYSSKLASNLYKYQEDLLAGQRPSMPPQVSAFSAAQNTMRLNMKDYYKRINYLLLPHDTSVEVSLKCIEAWSYIYGNDLKLKIIGHSFGGNAARKIVQSLDQKYPQIQNIDMLILDSRSAPLGYNTSFRTTHNVRQNNVYFQKGMFPGYKYKGPHTTNHPKITSKDLKSIKVPCKGSNAHMKMTCTPRVQKAYRAILQE